MTDRNLLFGILALQMDFITRDQLVAAMHGWVLDKRKPLAEVLVEQQSLDAKTRAMLDAMVDRHVELHQGDPQKSLAALSSAASAREALARIADGDVAASLVHVRAGRDRPDPLATASLAAPSVSGARFRILRPHARGGLGEVFVARDAELQRDVALKEIQARHADDPVSRTRFALEAEITGGLEHPGIVPVYSLGHYADGRPFYAMRFIKGDSLMTAIEQYHRPRVDATHRAAPDADPQFRQLLRRFYDVCNAIEYAHSRGVLHRDLKPGNIMLGRYGETLVVDWGLAKALGKPGEPSATANAEDEVPLVPASGSGSASTLPGAALGTPAYMSPEQALGRLDLLGPASDVYSLGATLYCLLTGRAPFTDKVVADTLAKVQRGDFPAPRQLNPNVPAPLEAVCLKAMAVRPADRYASAADLGRDLERWLDDTPVSAWPEPFTVKARRWMNRNRTLVSASAAAVLVACVSLGVAAVMLGSAYDAEKQARENAVSRAQEVTRLNAELVTANVAEKAAKNDALESEKLALHQSDVALKSLTTIVNQVQDELEDVPGTGAARKNLLNEALRLLRTVNETPGNTAKLLAQRLVAHNQMGQIYWAQQRRREAEEQFKLSRALALQALALEPKSDRARKDAAASTLKTADAWIYYHGDPDAAVPLLHECLKLYEAMVGDLRKHPNGNPALPLAQRVLLRDAERGLADTLDRFAEVASRASDLAKAADWLEKAKAIRQRLYDETDRADHMRRDVQVSILGQSIMLLASLRYAQGDLKANLAGRKQVALLRREVAEHRPNSLRALGLWAAAEEDLSDALLLSGEAKEALACAVKSLQVLQQVAAAHPEDADYRGRLAHAYYRTAVGWMRLGDRKAALGEFHKSLAIRQKLHDEQPDATMRQQHKQPIMLLVARCGDHATAEKLALVQREFWLKKKANSIPLSEIASCFALCLDAVAPEKKESQLSAEEKKLRQQYVELALETFRQAQESGFVDAIFVDYDPDVDPLRGIPAFEEWRTSFKRGLQAAK